MNLRIAITDDKWFEYLRRQPGVDEVNFWQPGGGRRFAALEPGEPFLFKLHAPLNFIVGGGFFAHFSALPTSRAWEAFREKNGATSLPEMRARIEKYRKSPPNPHEDYVIGCIILIKPFFLNEEEWIPVPDNFSRHIQQGKNYDIESSPGREIWEAVKRSLPGQVVGRVGDEVRWTEGWSRRRLGQGGFQFFVLDAYGRRCAVTREKALPVLEAAHIMPVSQGGTHDPKNGLLLRRDIHALFDEGYVTVDPDLRLRVSTRLKQDYDDGEYYSTFDRAGLALPGAARNRPDPTLLEWHSDTLFKG
ncbi:MAG: HNH endonuclease [Gemmatimonadota bacterium]